MRMDVTDLAWEVFAGGTVCDTSGAAVEVFEDHFLALDDQLTDAACIAAISNRNFTQRRLFPLGWCKSSSVLPTKPVLMPAVLARTV